MSAQPAKTDEEKKPAPKVSPFKTLLIRLGLGLVLFVALIWGLIVFVHSLYYESTDDAFVEGHVVTVGTKLSNTVRDVLIDDNYEVTKGQLLVQIDPRDYQVQLDAARANYDKTKSDFDRNLALANSKAISTADLDAARGTFDVAKSQLDQAKLNLDYTRITAPVAGRITRKAVEPGDYIQTGQTLFSIVPHDIWIIANFKETQLTYMLPGQPVKIRIDAFPGKVFKGRVNSLQAGTGARFSLLPPENATGNYVKVVQRVPVKILFDEPPDVQAAFAPGLSVVPEVNISVVPEGQHR
jgi:membrane fusion protein, multidrug efflux system